MGQEAGGRRQESEFRSSGVQEFRSHKAGLQEANTGFELAASRVKFSITWEWMNRHPQIGKPPHSAIPELLNSDSCLLISHTPL
jgi:hypothetical protein